MLEPTADGFRNYFGAGHTLPEEHLLVERANLLALTASEVMNCCIEVPFCGRQPIPLRIFIQGPAVAPEYSAALTPGEPATTRRVLWADWIDTKGRRLWRI